MIRRLRFLLEALAFTLLLAATRILPRRVLVALGSFGGSVGFVLDRRRQRIGLDNLRLAFGARLPAAEARGILRDCWRQFGRAALETLAFRRLRRGPVSRLVDYEGLEHIRKAYASGKGVLVFSGHFGHWELAAFLQGCLDLPLSLIVRPLDNPYLDKLLARLRGSSGNRIIHKRRAVREMIRAMREKRGVAIVIDQDARESGIFVPFFGRPASTTPTLALVALRTGAVVIPCFSVPLPRGRYRIVYEPPVPVIDTGDREEDVHRLTGQCTSIIERWVRRHPESWLWMHRRWKTTPAEGDSG